MTARPDNWRLISTNSPPIREEVLGFWQYLYPGDRNITYGWSVGYALPNGSFKDWEGIHAPGVFTHWQPLEPPLGLEGGE